MVERGAQTVDVGGVGDGLGVEHLLGRHVRGRTHRHAGHGQSGRVVLPDAGPDRLGEAEIGELGRAIGSEQDVGRLDVAVEDPARVEVDERLADLQHHLGRLDPGQALTAVDRRFEGDAGHQFEGHPVDAVLGAVAGDRHHVRVGQRVRQLGLAPETGHGLLVLGGLAGQHLDRDMRAAGQRTRLVDRGHRAGAEPFEQLIPGDGASDQGIAGVGGAGQLQLARARRAGESAVSRLGSRDEFMLACGTTDADGHGPMLRGG